MYGTKEQNKRRLDLLKHFQHKYFTNKDRGGIFKVVDFVIDYSSKKSMKIVFVEMGLKTKFSEYVSSYSILVKILKASYCHTKLGFKREFNLVHDKDNIFELARKLD